ncbi:MAG TPA: YfiR family protein [Verrucomicrobiae bacterium]|nr:YfiR family protein [Verrucomicrobiae bacterium]
MKSSEPKSEESPAQATQPFMHLRATPILGLSLAWLLTVGGGRAQETPPTEYKLKAAFLFNFAKYVEWPPAAFAEATSPMVIGILGENPFRDDLEPTIRDKTINNRPLVIKEFRSPAEATNCHILFISTSEKQRLPEILKSLHGTSVLTVGETDRFTETGGMINFVTEGNKIRFQINVEAAKSAGLKVSSKLLSLASRPAR